MLCKQNSGKYLDSKWHADRERAMKHSDDTDQEWLELSDDDIGGVNNPDTFEIRTSPIDSETPSKKKDWRNQDEYN